MSYPLLSPEADIKLLEKIGKRVILSMTTDAYEQIITEVQQEEKRGISRTKSHTSRTSKKRVEMGYIDVSELTKEQRIAWERAKKAPLSSFANL